MRTNAPTKTELVNHPVRMRLIGAVGAGQMTTRQMAEALPEIAQATLYRQVQMLAKGGIFEVVGTRQAHGAVECTYALKRGSTHFTREEFSSLSPDDHRECQALLLADASNSLGRYLAQSAYDSTEDGMTYFGAHIAMTDEDARQFRLDLLDLIRRYDSKGEPGVRKRSINVSVIPSPNHETPRSHAQPLAFHSSLDRTRR